MKSKVTDKEINKEIGKNLKQIRRSFRSYLTAEVVAAKLGMSRVSYTQLENGHTHISAVNLWKLACIFGCDLNEFFPKPPEGYELSQKDLSAIQQVDARATKWAEDLFGKVNS